MSVRQEVDREKFLTMDMQVGVNFINIFLRNFLYQRLFGRFSLVTCK